MSLHNDVGVSLVKAWYISMLEVFDLRFGDDADLLLLSSRIRDYELDQKELYQFLHTYCPRDLTFKFTGGKVIATSEGLILLHLDACGGLVSAFLHAQPSVN